MSDEPTIHQALNLVMRDLGPIGKTSMNEHQKYRFRGIDAVMNHLQPVLAQHGVFFVPEVLDIRTETRQSKAGDPMNTSYVTMRYTWFGPAGDSIISSTVGEATDSADKATNKAMSAALKYAVIHTLCIPTDDMDDGDRTTVEASAVDHAWVAAVTAEIAAAEEDRLRAIWTEVGEKLAARQITSRIGTQMRAAITARVAALKGVQVSTPVGEENQDETAQLEARELRVKELTDALLAATTSPQVAAIAVTISAERLEKALTYDAENNALTLGALRDAALKRVQKP